ncbi:MAG: hypothetical protein ACI9LM_000718 [Alteromonadaceae bacterium]
MTIQLSFSTLNQWQQVAYSAAIIERMLPNYKLFAEAVEFGDVKLLRNQLDLVWQWLDKNNRCKINYEAQLSKLELHIPNPEEFDSFGVFPALDVCMAIVSLFQIMQDKDSDGCLSVSRLSENSVSYYVELILAQEKTDESDISQEEIAIHPLMKWELETQVELYDFIKLAPENKNSCIYAKSLVLEEGLSNLGIEI